jgi:2-phosphosulfolactate phosphatase
MRKTVLIHSFDRYLPRELEGYAIVVVDVVRATTTAITAATRGRRCFVVPSLTTAFELAKTVRDPLLGGEQLGVVPSGFHIGNSPSELSRRVDIDRPLILLSSSGTRLCHEAAKFDDAFVACLRNYPAVGAYLQRFDRVAIIGAASRGEFREEDQICCSRIAAQLFELDYLPANAATDGIVKRWGKQPVSSWLQGDSAAYLRRSGQLADLQFIVDHVGDVDSVFRLRGAEVVNTTTTGTPPSLGVGAIRVAQ